LKHIYSTASPLAPALFDYVYQHISPDVLLASITGECICQNLDPHQGTDGIDFSGGTDICSLFAGMCTALPVFRGEIQCRMLGMAVESFDLSGSLQKPGETGELVCLKPFPCMPVGFWPLEGFGNEELVKSGKDRYQQAYFSNFTGVWCESPFLFCPCNIIECR
jgi:acetoacetyl-CoA synthetase